MNKFFEWVKGIFVNAKRIFKALITAAFPIAKQLVIGALSDFSYSIVKELAAGNLTSEEKQKEAFKRIKDEAIKEGLELKDSLINVIIELVYQKYKNEEVSN